MAEDRISPEVRFEKSIAVLIALTSIFIALTAYLERLASNRSEELERAAQQLSVESTTETINGVLRYSYDWQGAFQTWRELDLMAINADQLGEFDRADLYRAARDQIRILSPILQPPHFDEQFNWPGPAGYQADLYIVDAARLQEQFASKSMVANSWDQIANNFVLQITLYAVVLSLFGLSTTIHSFVRWLFLVLGGFIILANLLWTAVLLNTPVEEIPAGAIEDYAHGVGLLYRGQYEPDPDERAELLQAAVERFNAAIQKFGERPGAPMYANAFFEVANAHLTLGEYEAARLGYLSTLQAGRVDTTVLWNLGWTQYLMGRFDEAVATNQRALEIDPTLVGLRLNQGLNMLAQGRFDNAIEEYRLALVEAERQIAEARAGLQAVPPSLWYYMDAGAIDIQSLLDQVSGSPKSWTQAPAPNLVTTDLARLRTTAAAEIERLKEFTVSLEFFGTSPHPAAGGTVSAFAFVQETYDENGEFIEYVDSTVNEFGANQIGVRFDYTGFQPGAHELWKVYVNGYEDTTLRVIGNWELAESGSAIKRISYAFSNVFVFLPGEYRVELYIDTQLMQTGTFTVLSP